MKYMLFVLSTMSIAVGFLVAMVQDNVFGVCLSFGLLCYNLSVLEQMKEKYVNKKENKSE